MNRFHGHYNLATKIINYLSEHEINGFFETTY